MRNLTNHFTCSLILLLYFCSCGNNKYRIHGTVLSEFNGATVTLESYNDMDSIIYSDSTVVKNGKFTFKGKELLEGYSEIRAVHEDGRYRYTVLFLELGNIYLYLGETEKYNKLYSTPLNDIYQSHIDSIYYYVSEINRLDTTDTNHITFTAGTELADAWHNYGAYFIRFKRNNIDNIVGRSEFLREPIVNIPESFYRGLNDLSFHEMYDFLDSALLNHPKVLKYLEDEQNRIIKNQNQKLVGYQYTDFELLTPDGEKKRLSDYVGKHEYVYLDFWASWCGPCIYDLPHLKEVYDKYHNKGLEIIGITLDSDKNAWTGAIARHEIPWPNLWSPENISSVRKAYENEGVPYGVLIDKSGKVISAYIGSTGLDILYKSLPTQNEE